MGRSGVTAWHPQVGARFAYVGIILLATLTGLEPDFDRALVAARLANAFDPSVAARDVVDGLRNVALFAGWGVVWLATAPGTRIVRRVGEATFSGMLLSVAVEVTQLLSPVRNASVLDVGTNTIGAFAGAAFVVLAAWAIHQKVGARSFVGIPAFVFAGAYLATAVLEAFIPLFGQETLAGASGGMGSRLAYALEAFEWHSLAELPLTRILLFAPAGALWVATLAEEGVGYRDAWRRTALGALALAVAIELLRGGAGQPILAGSALVHASAAALGAWIAARSIPPLTVRYRGPARARVLYLAYAVILILWSWRPFAPLLSIEGFAEQLAVGRLIPLTSHAMRMDLFSVADVARQCLILMPVGALLAVWPLRRIGPLSGFLPGVYVAASLEVGQLFLADRFFDVTDALVGIAGVLIGWVLVTRTGFRPYGEALPKGGISHPGAGAGGS